MKNVPDDSGFHCTAPVSELSVMLLGALVLLKVIGVVPLTTPIRKLRVLSTEKVTCWSSSIRGGAPVLELTVAGANISMNPHPDPLVVLPAVRSWVYALV